MTYYKMKRRSLNFGVFLFSKLGFVGFDAVHLPGVFAAVGIGVGPDEPLVVETLDVEGEPAVAVGCGVGAYFIFIFKAPVAPDDA